MKKIINYLNENKYELILFIIINLLIHNDYPMLATLVVIIYGSYNYYKGYTDNEKENNTEDEQ